MKTYYEKDYFIIGYDENKHLLVSKWITAPTSAEYREGMNAIIAAIEHFKTGKMISDATNLGTLLPDDQLWTATEWFERAVKTGYTHVAAVLPSDIFTQLSVEDTYSQVVTPIEYANFDNMEDAEAWMNKF